MLTGANLDGANLSGSSLIAANLTSANLTSSRLIGSNLIGANLNAANLSGADLRDISLDVSMLADEDIARDPTLSSLNELRREQIFVDAQLNGINYDSQTLWPKSPLVQRFVIEK